MQRPLVALESQNIVAALVNDLPGDGALAGQGGERPDGGLEGQHVPQFWDGSNFVGLGLGRDLCQDKALIPSPGADHVQRRRAARSIEGPAQNLAVDRDDAWRQFRKARHETLKTGAERLWIQ